MLGNWATGKLRIVSAPTNTMTMEMTMATIGRLMKNFDIGYLSLASMRKRPRVHFCALPHLLDSLGDDSFSPIQPTGDHPHATDTVTDRDGSNANLVVSIHHRDLVCALQL